MRHLWLPYVLTWQTVKHEASIHQAFTSRFAQEIDPSWSIPSSQQPASWWNHSTPFAVRKPFKASCTPSSFSPAGAILMAIMIQHDQTNKFAQWARTSWDFNLRKNEYKWGPAAWWDGDSNTINIGQRTVKYQISSSGSSKTAADDAPIQKFVSTSFVDYVLLQNGGCIGASQTGWIPKNHGCQC